MRVLYYPPATSSPASNEGPRKVVGPEEYKSLRDFQNDCFAAYVERQAACCGGRVSRAHLPNPNRKGVEEGE